MHALVVRATVHNADRTREVLNDSEENARAAGDRVSANFSQLESRDDLTLDGVEVREVVASA